MFSHRSGVVCSQWLSVVLRYQLVLPTGCVNGQLWTQQTRSNPVYIILFEVCVAYMCGRSVSGCLPTVCPSSTI